MKNIINILIISGVVIFGLLFYWFQVRPANIRGFCADEAYNYSNDYYSVSSKQDRYDYQYKKCINSKGLR